MRCMRHGRKMTLSAYAPGVLAGLEGEFGSRGWLPTRMGIVDEGAKLAAGFRKRRVQVEIQFDTSSHWHESLFRLQTSHSRRRIDIGAIVLPTKRYARSIEDDTATFEIAREQLPLAKMTVDFPILLIGIEPWEIKPWKI